MNAGSFPGCPPVRSARYDRSSTSWLTTKLSLLTLAPWFAWPQRRVAAHASPAITPGARRQALNKFWYSVVLTINGILLILSAHSDTAARIGIVTGSALFIWMLGALFVSRRQHRSAA
jgi:hypothetical protein